MVKTIHEPENDNACWVGREATRCKFGYRRTTFYIPGLGGPKTLSSHVVLWVCLESGAKTANDMYLAYLEFKESGLTIDHLCWNPECRNPDHLEVKTFIDNIANQRRFN